MAEEGKKISFGFAKSIKKPVLKNAIPQEKKKVDYIECLDEKGIKVIGEEEKKDEPLIIPLLGSKTWHDRIVNKIDADIFLPKADKEKVGDASVNEAKSKLSNGKTSPIISIKKEPVEDSENKVVTLEEQAAKEIIEDLKSKNEHETKTNDLTLPLVEDESLRGKEQSTLEDYEKIPIDAFGVAMLRGMGWQPGKGIGRNEKLVAAVIPELRPKGMGLGADKVALQKKNTDSKKEKEEVKIEKGTFVKIIAGKQSNNYGQIEGFDDDAGRLIIKLALGGNIISIQKSMRNIRTRNPRDSSKRWIEKDQCPLTPKTVKMVTKVVIKERKSEVRCTIRTSMIKWGIKNQKDEKGAPNLMMTAIVILKRRDGEKEVTLIGMILIN
ncbi:G-patch domain and KOW motifs-containing protein-like isoform X9 [Bombus affinis]|uniref:G-patch domain and KOW motifs-containing protein-like isoform X9 n=1 Tax=Bombus affinis TaxID=309941 RepID=UPI0021B7C771|nr:G-patch domain and KOW motifs-containing protein-like isoform X9 [Bombus affinis]